MQIVGMLGAEWSQILLGSVSTGAKEDESSTGRVWAAGFHRITARSCSAHVSKFMSHLFLQFTKIFFFGPR
jgi:hypothetical protein